VFADEVYQSIDGFVFRDIETDWFLAHVEVDLVGSPTHVAEVGVSHLTRTINDAAHDGDFHAFEVLRPSFDARGDRLQIEQRASATRAEHLKGVKIAIMGCIVNGPGEMADADFGYVGGAPNKINLYVGKKPVRFNIPEDEAVDRLVDLIREHGKWRDPEVV